MAFGGLSVRCKSAVFWQTGVNLCFNTHQNGRYYGVSRINVRKEYPVSILAIRRKGEAITNPCGEVPLEPDDTVIVIGAPHQMILSGYLMYSTRR